MRAVLNFEYKMTVSSSNNNNGEVGSMAVSKGVKLKCEDTMVLFGVPQETREFCMGLVDLEYMMAADTIRLKEAFRDDFELDQSQLTTPILFIQSRLQESLGRLREWSARLEEHHKRLASLPVLKAPHKVKSFKAPCVLKNKQIEVQEGDLLEVIDSSQDNVVKVKTDKGQEGIIPIMALLLPSTDQSLQALLERLQVLLLCTWFECFRLFFAQLYNLTYAILTHLKYRSPSLASQSKGPRSSRDLKLLKKLVNRLELDYLDDSQLKQEGVVPKQQHVHLVSKLSEAYKSYQAFQRLFKGFKTRVAGQQQPLCILDKLSDFKAHIMSPKPIKYYRTTVVQDSVETVEEILHYPNDDVRSTTSSVMSSHDHTRVESERLTSSSQEVKQRFVIKSIKDPRDDSEVTLDTAIAKGILDMSRGLYINPSNGETIPIGTAMAQGKIVVQAVTEVASKAKVEQYGMLTVESLVEDPNSKDEREFRVVSVVDPLTAERLSEEEACKRGWLKGGWEGGEWVDGARVGGKWVGDGVFRLTGDHSLSIHEAVDEGWIKAEVTNKERMAELERDANYEAKTYVIKTVMNSRNGRMVPFNEAMRLNLLDIDSGCFVDKQTEERVPLEEALKRGLVKGRLVKEGEGSMIDPSNKLVAKNLGAVKNAASAVAAFKKNAAGGGGGSVGVSGGGGGEDRVEAVNENKVSKEAPSSTKEEAGKNDNLLKNHVNNFDNRSSSNGSVNSTNVKSDNNVDNNSSNNVSEPVTETSKDTANNTTTSDTPATNNGLEDKEEADEGDKKSASEVGNEKGSKNQKKKNKKKK